MRWTKPDRSRRDVLLGVGAAALTACVSRGGAGGAPRPPEGATSDADTLARIEASVGGRAGVFALDLASGQSLGRREDERFAMCSTFKWVLGAAILERVDRGDLRLEERVPYGPADLLENAATTREHVAEGSMTIDGLARAAITRSDNTAANLLLARLGGPAQVTAFVRRAGDGTTRLDRIEPALNSNEPRDERDTTSPGAMANLVARVACGDVLAPPSRDRLNEWLRACETGKKRLRAGLPADCVVGDKTGTGERGSVNDVAVVVAPGTRPIVIAAYLSETASPVPDVEAALAAIGRVVAARFGLA